MKHSLVVFGPIGVSLGLGVSIAAQQPPAFRVESRLVAVEATVACGSADVVKRLVPSTLSQ